jgi:hypothetical protein
LKILLKAKDEQVQQLNRQIEELNASKQLDFDKYTSATPFNREEYEVHE